MATDKLRVGILTDVDTLLDTRLGVVCQYSDTHQSEHFKKVIDQYPRYSRRLSDQDISAISGLEDYPALYEQRTKSVIPYSLTTKVLDIIKALVAKLRANVGTVPIDYDAKIYVNVHPYHLTDFEKSELQLVLTEAMGRQYIDVDIVDIDLATLSVYDIRARFHYLYLYHYDRLLDALSQSDGIKQVQIIDRVIVAPALILGDVKAVLEQHDSDLMQLFEMLQKVSEPYVKLEYIDISHYVANIDTSAPTEDSAASL